MNGNMNLVQSDCRDFQEVFSDSPLPTLTDPTFLGEQVSAAQQQGQRMSFLLLL